MLTVDLFEIVISFKFSSKISNPNNQSNLSICTVQIKPFDFVIDLVHSFHFIILYNQVVEPEPWFMLLLMYYHFIRNIKQLTRAGYITRVVAKNGKLDEVIAGD